jgi:autotransporter passenger strand-loop-strand repeat protein
LTGALIKEFSNADGGAALDESVDLILCEADNHRGAEIRNAGGTAEVTSVLSAGTLQVDLGGSASGSVVSSGGAEIISAGGTDLGAQIPGGEQDVLVARFNQFERI